MSRITERFDQCRRDGRKALIPYLVAGDPDPDTSLALLHELVAAGADLLEVGVPFSDPMADGPVIQAACERALGGVRGMADVLDLVSRFRERDATTPVVLMGYLNPMEQMGYGSFAARAQAAGVDGVLTVDLPPEEADTLVPVLQAHGLDPIWLIAPTTRPERLQRVVAMAQGFIYYVSLKGVTGADTLDVDDVARHVEDIRRYSALPVGVGFGVRDAATAARVARAADAVVVGSALVRRVEEGLAERATLPAHVAELIREMRRAMDAPAAAAV